MIFLTIKIGQDRHNGLWTVLLVKKKKKNVSGRIIQTRITVFR